MTYTRGAASFSLPERGSNLDSFDRLSDLGHRFGFDGFVCQAKKFSLEGCERRRAPAAVAAAVPAVKRRGSTPGTAVGWRSASWVSTVRRATTAVLVSWWHASLLRRTAVVSAVVSDGGNSLFSRFAAGLLPVPIIVGLSAACFSSLRRPRIGFHVDPGARAVLVGRRKGSIPAATRGFSMGHGVPGPFQVSTVQVVVLDRFITRSLPNGPGRPGFFGIPG